MSDIMDTDGQAEDLGDATISAASIQDFGVKQSAQGAQAATDEDGEEKRNLDTILGIPVDVQVVLGSATMLVANLLKLGRGSVIPLNHRVGEPVDIVVNGRVVARGEVVVVEDDNSRFGVSLTEIIANQSGSLES